MSFLITRGYGSKLVIGRGFGSVIADAMAVIAELIFRREAVERVFRRSAVDRVFTRASITQVFRRVAVSRVFHRAAVVTKFVKQYFLRIFRRED